MPMGRVPLAALLTTVVQGAAPDIYAQAPTTTLGCECAGPCSTGIFFECNTAPMCTVKSDNCKLGKAPWSLTQGSYDYCVFPPDHAYESKTAQEKKAIVLAHVNKDKTSGHYPPLAKVLFGIMGESVRLSFDASSDVFPTQREKYIHSVGVVGGISFESTGTHSYAGLFQGAEHGIVRFSSAKDTASGVAPGMGVKFFRDGRPSSNFVAMYSLDGQTCPETNFFAHDWNNHIEKTDNFGLKLIAAKFWQASFCPLMVGLADLASSPDGASDKFPFKLNFHALVKSDCLCGKYDECLKNLEDIPVGTKLFEVRAENSVGSELELIGHITLTDALTASKFGDEELFFKHQHMEKDFELRPDLFAAIKDDRATVCGMGCTGLKPPVIAQGCSSPFNNTGMLKMLKDDVVV